MAKSGNEQFAVWSSARSPKGHHVQHHHNRSGGGGEHRTLNPPPPPPPSIYGITDHLEFLLRSMNGLGRSGCHCRLMSSSSFPWWVLTFGRHSCMMATACTPQLFKCQMFTVCFSSKLNTEGSATPPFLSTANRDWPFRHREYERFIPATWNCLLHVLHSMFLAWSSCITNVGKDRHGFLSLRKSFREGKLFLVYKGECHCDSKTIVTRLLLSGCRRALKGTIAWSSSRYLSHDIGTMPSELVW